MKLSLNKKKVIAILLGILILIILYTLKNTNYFVRISTFIFSIFLFFITDFLFKLNFKISHYLILIIIAITGILFSPLYFLYPSYDKILHFINPFLISILVYFLADRAKIKFSTKLLITLSVVVMFLTIFEIVEFGVDSLFDFKLQGVYTIDKLNIIMDRNDDTMMDLIFGTLGSLIFILYKTFENNFKKIKKRIMH